MQRPEPASEPEPPVKLSPNNVRRRCTDFHWLLIFSGALALLGVVVVFAVQNGKLSHLRFLADYKGNLCGRGAREDQPLLFYCMADWSLRTLDLDNPICVSECPTSTLTNHTCPFPSNTGVMHVVQDYPSHPFMVHVCKPWEYDLATIIEERAREWPIIMRMNTVRFAWEILAADAVLAVLLSFAYIALLRVQANCLVWTGLLILTVVPAASGLWAIWTHSKLEDTASVKAAGLGAVGVLVGCTFLVISCNLKDRVNTAVACIEWSCQCVLETPSLKLEPLICLCCRVMVFLFMAFVGLNLVSSGIDSENYQEVHYGIETQVCLAWLIFMTYWIQQVITAASNFIVIYTSQLWYFGGGIESSGKAPLCMILRGWLVIMRYHLGTAVIAGLIIGLLQPIRIILGLLTSFARMEGSPVSCLLSGCCMCCVDIYEGFFDRFRNTVYMDVALNGRPFVQASIHAQEVKNSQADTVHILNGATWLFQLAGIGMVMCLGHLLTWVIRTRVPAYADPASKYHVENKEFLQLCSLIVSGVVAFPFMMLFDLVSDTILYCWGLEQQQQAELEMQGGGFISQRACGDVAGFLVELVSCNCAGRPRPMSLVSPSHHVFTGERDDYPGGSYSEQQPLKQSWDDDDHDHGGAWGGYRGQSPAVVQPRSHSRDRERPDIFPQPRPGSPSWA